VNAEHTRIVLGEGILRVEQIRTRTGPILAVGLATDTGRQLFGLALPSGEEATLIAVHLHHQTKSSPKGKHQVLVRRKTIETPIRLGRGLVITFPTTGLQRDAVSLRPIGDDQGTWLDPAALAQVRDKPVRLELEHHFTAPGTPC
jgi:hypothetical protein